MKSYLKVKIKSLAEESRIIRHEEYRVKAHRKWAQDRQAPEAKINRLAKEYDGLYRHRTYDVRNEARAAQLAYAIIRGRPYATVEPAGSCPAPTDQIARLVRKYGASASIPQEALVASVCSWLKGAVAA